ncbi:MerR family transcriptional regulator [Bacillus toyonensis]|uniref:MerR family transcriptional regulator n=1 Tax=Bacillus toyonensis TaxID=155322 RepID=A0AB36T971_9BACI|nr:MerR family transcriptional regulator [Bacillus toyonensis]EEL59264.1 SpoVID-dependent spore coat assembly factor [Bacillus cereus Rock4-18]PEC09638.1 MerR family transcriptional regulator [Bacillus toyonensis]PEN54833.1 MerR family transcriptional regulator [Bacillus toyonensis]PEN91525.1 MerR family transcriptional regulator [Bacillus toyonensis]PHA71353.1 MerR family transcriptional regulator [Bacillus toyonensis]
MYKIGEVAELTGMGIHTLRYYEKLGLLPPPTRNSGIRQYTEGDVRLLKFLYSLKQTGMSLEEIAEFASDGCIIEEIKQRKEEVPTKVKKRILTTHLERLKEQQEQLQKVVQLTEEKLEIYYGFLEEKNSEADNEE